MAKRLTMANRMLLLQQKANVFTTCRNVFAPANYYDCSPQEMKTAISDAANVFRNDYPDFERLKTDKRVRKNTPDGYAISIEKYLQVCFEGEGVMPCTVISDLANALKLVEDEIDGIQRLEQQA